MEDMTLQDLVDLCEEIKDLDRCEECPLRYDGCLDTFNSSIIYEMKQIAGYEVLDTDMRDTMDGKSYFKAMFGDVLEV